MMEATTATPPIKENELMLIKADKKDTFKFKFKYEGNILFINAEIHIVLAALAIIGVTALSLIVAL